MVVVLTVIFSWVYNDSRESILIASLVHSVIDTHNRFGRRSLDVGVPNSTAGEMSLKLTYLIGFRLLALVILVLTRGRLGYRPTPLRKSAIGARSLSRGG